MSWEPLLGSPIIDGNRVQSLRNGAEIFPSMLAAVRGVKVRVIVPGKKVDDLIALWAARADWGE